MIIMCLRFVISWILVNGLITPFGSPVSRGTETNYEIDEHRFL